jgi:hypothetical protein
VIYLGRRCRGRKKIEPVVKGFADCASTSGRSARDQGQADQQPAGAINIAAPPRRWRSG